jgi:glycosyltransferase involved in cell wall biosynthesis
MSATVVTPRVLRRPVRDRGRSRTESVGDVATRGPMPVAVVIARLEGGAGVLALRGARALDPHDFAVTIITGSGGRLREEAASAGLEVIIEPALRAPIAPFSDVRALWHLVGLLGERRFAVVHTHCAKAGALGRLAARRAGVPRIVHTYHGFPFHDFQSRVRRQTYVAIEQRLGRFTDVTLCVGTGVATEAIRRGLGSPERVRTIGVAVDGPDVAVASMSARNPQARRRARAALGAPLEGPVVGTVGRLTYQKAPEDFVSAMVALGRPEVVGVLVGGGELTDRIGRLTRSMSGPRVLMAGERTDVLEVLPAFDVFVLPSLYEGLPTAIVEAMICGVPVVATAVNAVPDLVVPGETGLLVPPGRPDLIAGAVRFLLDSPHAAARMATTARERLGDRYGEAALRDALAAAYTSPREGVGAPPTTLSPEFPWAKHPWRWRDSNPRPPEFQ